MDINITQDPPADVFQTKKKYRRIIPYLLAMIFCAILLAGYQIVFGSIHGTVIENIALVFFVGPALVFFYCVEKLHDYKTLSPEQEKEMEDFCRQDHDIAAYCAKVSMMGRKLVKAEYDACKAQVGDR
jgi:predicted membrane channel-forming protein YqfA (hemolysin III family)